MKSALYEPDSQENCAGFDLKESVIPRQVEVSQEAPRTATAVLYSSKPPLHPDSNPDIDIVTKYTKGHKIKGQDRDRKANYLSGKKKRKEKRDRKRGMKGYKPEMDYCFSGDDLYSANHFDVDNDRFIERMRRMLNDSMPSKSEAITMSITYVKNFTAFLLQYSVCKSWSDVSKLCLATALQHMNSDVLADFFRGHFAVLPEASSPFPYQDWRKRVKEFHVNALQLKDTPGFNAVKKIMTILVFSGFLSQEQLRDKKIGKMILNAFGSLEKQEDIGSFQIFDAVLELMDFGLGFLEMMQKGNDMTWSYLFPKSASSRLALYRSWLQPYKQGTLEQISGKTSEEYRNLVCQLELEIEMIIGTNSTKGSMAIIYEQAYLQVNKLRVEVESYDLSWKTRKAPYNILFYGGSKVGKSGLMNEANQRIAAMLQMCQGNKKIFHIAESDAYESGLRNDHLIYNFDDVGNSKIDNVDPSKTKMCQFIHMSNNVPSPSHQAAVEDKGKIWHHPQAIILTSNFPSGGLEKITNKPESYSRRMELVEVRVMAKYCMPNGMLDESKVEYTEDKSHRLPVNEFSFYDIRVNGQTVQKLQTSDWMSSSEFWKEIGKRVHKHNEQQELFVNYENRTDKHPRCKLCGGEINGFGCACDVPVPVDSQGNLIELDDKTVHTSESQQDKYFDPVDDDSNVSEVFNEFTPDDKPSNPTPNFEWEDVASVSPPKKPKRPPNTKKKSALRRSLHRERPDSIHSEELYAKIVEHKKGVAAEADDVGPDLAPRYVYTADPKAWLPEPDHKVRSARAREEVAVTLPNAMTDEQKIAMFMRVQKDHFGSTEVRGLEQTPEQFEAMAIFHSAVMARRRFPNSEISDDGKIISAVVDPPVKSDMQGEFLGIVYRSLEDDLASISLTLILDNNWARYIYSKISTSMAYAMYYWEKFWYGTPLETLGVYIQMMLYYTGSGWIYLFFGATTWPARLHILFTILNSSVFFSGTFYLLTGMFAWHPVFNILIALGKLGLFSGYAVYMTAKGMLEQDARVRFANNVMRNPMPYALIGVLSVMVLVKQLLPFFTSITNSDGEDVQEDSTQPGDHFFEDPEYKFEPHTLDPVDMSDVKARRAEDDMWLTPYAEKLPCPHALATMTEDQVISAVSGNLVHVALSERGGTKVAYGHAFFINNEWALLAAHGATAELYDVLITREPENSSTRLKTFFYDRRPIPDTDYVLYRSSTHLCKPSMMKYFVDVPTKTSCCKMISHAGPKYLVRPLLWKPQYTSNGVISSQGSQYNLKIPSKPGDCISPILSMSKPHQIYGFHMGGNGTISVGFELRASQVLSIIGEDLVPLNHEVLNDLKLVEPANSAKQEEKVREERAIQPEMDSTSEMTPFPSDESTSDDTEVFVDDWLGLELENAHGETMISLNPVAHPRASVNFLMYDEQNPAHIFFYGEDPHFITSPRSDVKTSIISSHLESAGYPNKWGPPPFHSGRDHSKYLQLGSKPIDPINPILLDRSLGDYTDGVIAQLQRLRYPKERLCLTLDETLNGVPGDRFLKRIDETTAAGIGYGKHKSKHLDVHYKPNGEKYFTPLPYLKQNISERFILLSQGKLVSMFVRSALKDEPTEKKVRIFAVLRLDWLLLGKMLFGKVVSALLAIPLIAEMFQGISVLTEDWTEMYNHIIAFEPTQVGEGDYSKYDTTISGQLIRHVGKALCSVARFIGHDESIITAMRSYMKCLAMNAWMYNGSVFVVDGWNPSGCWLTAVINGIGNSLLHRCCFYSYGSFDRSFRDFVHLATLGDDSLFSTTLPWFNCLTLEKFFTHIRMKYTATVKDGEIKPFVSAKDATFGKRTWRWEPMYAKMVAPLAIDSIFKSLHNYMASETDPVTITVGVVDNALLEFARHGPDVFREYQTLLQSVCRKAEIDHMVGKLYHDYEDLIIFMFERQFCKPYFFNGLPGARRSPIPLKHPGF